MKRQILCYGDSNTWGYRFWDQSRFDWEQRWTGRLQQALGPEYQVIEEGLCGRTVAVDDDIQPYRNGLRYLNPCLLSHLPLERIILMLGTNDTKCRYHLSPGEIAMAMERMIKEIKTTLYWMNSEAKILLISPVPFGETMPVDVELDHTSREKSLQLPELYRQLAKRHQIDFMAAGDYVHYLQDDACHLDERGHEELAEALYSRLMSDKG